MLVAEREGILAKWFSVLGSGEEDTPNRLSKRLNTIRALLFWDDERLRYDIINLVGFGSEGAL